MIAIEEDKGHMTIRRKVPIAELVEELKEIILEWFTLSTVPT